MSTRNKQKGYDESRVVPKRVEDVYQCSSSTSQCCSSSCVSSELLPLPLIAGEHLEISLPNNKQNAEENKRPIPGRDHRPTYKGKRFQRGVVGVSGSMNSEEEKSNSFRFV